MIRLMRAALVVTTMLAGTLAITAAPAAAYVDYCFGIRGNFKTGSAVIYGYFNPGPGDDKCFGISPDRRIWNTWAGAGGWHELPNNGRADHVCSNGVGFDRGTGYARVTVYVDNRGSYSSQYNPYMRRWMPWEHEPSFRCIMEIPD